MEILKFQFRGSSDKSFNNNVLFTLAESSWDSQIETRQNLITLDNDALHFKEDFSFVGTFNFRPSSAKVF